jgi:hypothetical protein
MAGTNLFQPNGLTVSGARSRAGGAGTYQNNLCTIKAGYGSNIGRGDLVGRGTLTNAGYAVLSLLADTSAWGVFTTVYPYYDLTAQQTMHGLIGSYTTAANPSTDIQASLVDDPFVTFIAQVSGGPWSQTWTGNNINFLAGTNGAPNTTGQSTLALDASTIANTNTLPFQILGVVGTVGGPQDPTFTNPWIEVRLNTSSLLNPTGR